MQQIIGICCAMIAHPQLLILDEPTLGLDLASTKIMTNMLKQLASHGIGILVTTHQLDFAQKVANKILLINHGQLVFDVANLLRFSLKQFHLICRKLILGGFDCTEQEITVVFAVLLQGHALVG